MSSKDYKFVLIHIGAGSHSEKLMKSGYMDLIKDACIEGIKSRTSLYASLNRSSRVIEASPWTNCSYGSSLSRNGKVVNDACVFLRKDGLTRQFALTSIKDYKFSITRCLNFLILDEINTGDSEIGINKPNFMIDNNFDYYARETERSFACSLFDDGKCKTNSELISTKAYRTSEYWINKTEIKDGQKLVIQDEVTDTVGVMVYDNENMICGVSSGGNLLKDDCRIGCAAIVGASCYSMNSFDLSPIFHLQDESYYEISMFASGNGEQIICNDICRSFCWKLLLIIHLEKSDIFEIPGKLKNMLQPFYAGVVAVISEFDSQTKKLLDRNIIYSHTTPSFVFGYCSKKNGFQYCASTSTVNDRTFIKGSEGILSCR